MSILLLNVIFLKVLIVFFFFLGKAKLASVPTGAAVAAPAAGAAAPAAAEAKGITSIFRLTSPFFVFIKYLNHKN